VSWSEFAVQASYVQFLQLSMDLTTMPFEESKKKNPRRNTHIFDLSSDEVRGYTEGKK